MVGKSGRTSLVKGLRDAAAGPRTGNVLSLHVGWYGGRYILAQCTMSELGPRWTQRSRRLTSVWTKQSGQGQTWLDPTNSFIRTSLWLSQSLYPGNRISGNRNKCARTDKITRTKATKISTAMNSTRTVRCVTACRDGGATHRQALTCVADYFPFIAFGTKRVVKTLLRSTFGPPPFSNREVSSPANFNWLWT